MRRDRWLAVLLVMSLCCGIAPARAESAGVSATALKAAVMTKLPGFIYWRQAALPPKRRVLCVLGDADLAASLERLARQQGADCRFELASSVADGGGDACDLIFIGRSAHERVASLVRPNAGRRVATVSDIPAFAQMGGMVELKLTAARVEVTLNRAAARAQGLDFSAQLLRLAQAVVE